MIDLLKEIGAWIGWFPTFLISSLIGITGLWVLNQRVRYLERENRDLRGFVPDAVARRLSERHKMQQETLELLYEDREKNKQQIVQLEEEKATTQLEMAKLQEQYATAMAYLHGTLPREGIVLPGLKEKFFVSAMKNGNLILDIETIGVKGDGQKVLSYLNTLSPFFLFAESNMSQLHLSITRGDENIDAGIQITNPIEGIFGNDYKTTLLDFLQSYFPIRNVGSVPPQMVLPEKCEFILSDDQITDFKFVIPIDVTKAINKTSP